MYGIKIVKVRKPHECYGCGVEMEPGASAERCGRLYLCLECVEYIYENFDTWDWETGFEKKEIGRRRQR